LDASYGVSDKRAVDLRVGYGKSEFAVDPVLAPQRGLDGLIDIMIGARYKVIDEVNGGPFTATLGVAAIIDGRYRTGAITALGDGGSGGLSFTDATSGIDIGGPGFSPAPFPEIEKDYKLWNVGATADSFSLSATYEQKFDGENTARSNFFRVALGFSF
jgi:hypothetical protein